MPDRYEAAWEELRNRRRQFVLAAAWPILLGAVSRLLKLPKLSPMPLLFIGLLLGWAVGFMLAWHRCFDWECPNCSEPFQRGRNGFGFFSVFSALARRRCPHCDYKMSGMPI
jgi:hypothetical protein